MNGDVRVRDVMNREYVGVSESDDLVDTAELLLREETDTAVVLRGSAPVGVLTCRDVLALVVEGPDPQTAAVEDAMTASVPRVEPETGLSTAADKMSAQSARRLVVTRGSGEEPIGVLTEHDVLATRPFGRDRTTAPEAEQGETVETNAQPIAGVESSAGETEGFEDQSICEGCGTLTSDLASFNGQLLCGDCRDM